MLKDQEPQGKFTQQTINETETSLTLQITYGQEVVVFTYSPPGKVVVEFNPAVEQKPEEPTPEPEKPVMLRGRFGIPFHVKESPTGGTMAVSSFGEHPSRAIWSYSNTLPQKPQKDTVWWQVAAFDERVELAKSIIIGSQEYDITCFPRTWKETEKNGKEKTVNGLYLLNAQPFVRRSQREPPK